jgi:hypothetical protein
MMVANPLGGYTILRLKLLGATGRANVKATTSLARFEAAALVRLSRPEQMRDCRKPEQAPANSIKRGCIRHLLHRQCFRC